MHKNIKIDEADVLSLRIIDADNLDPIMVHLQNLRPGAGRLTVECFGEAWSNAWAAMGDGATVQSFVLSCDNHYLAGKMLGTSRKDRVVDFAALREKALQDLRQRYHRGRQDAMGASFLIQNSELDEQSIQLDKKLFAALQLALGEDFYMDMPMRYSDEYTYLWRVLDAVKEGLRKLTT